MAEPLRLQLKLDGPLVDEHRLPLSELARVAEQLRSAVRDVAIALTDPEYAATRGRGGRTKGFIERATDLRVVAAPKAGSFVLDLEAPPPAPPEQEELAPDLDPLLAERAVEALIAGLETIGEADELPHGFDRHVLRSVSSLKTTLKKGIDRIELTTSRQKRRTGHAEIDSTKVKSVDRLIKKPVKGEATAQGVLQMVDFGALQCRIDRPPLPSVLCVFEESVRDHVQEAVRKFVRVSGEGEFDPGAIYPRRIVVSALEIIHEQLPFDRELFWQQTDLSQLAKEQHVAPFKPSKGADGDDWRNDDEAAALIAAIHGDS